MPLLVGGGGTRFGHLAASEGMGGWVDGKMARIISYIILSLSYLIFVSPDQRCPTHLILESDSVSESEC